MESAVKSVEEYRANLAAVNANIAAAAERAGRDLSEIRLLPVSKTIPEEGLRNAIAAGMHRLGENKVQEAKRKWQNLADLDVEWAVIGHLQRNKAKDVAEFASEFQALDSDRLAETLDRRLQSLGKSLDVYVQVNTSGEESKFGLTPDAAVDFIKTLPQYSALRVRGLMTLAIFSSDTERVRECFRVLRTVRDRVRDIDADLLGPAELSMGMSGDYEVAIEEGANCVRVGTAIFGKRNVSDATWWPGVS